MKLWTLNIRVLPKRHLEPILIYFPNFNISTKTCKRSFKTKTLEPSGINHRLSLWFRLEHHSNFHAHHMLSRQRLKQTCWQWVVRRTTLAQICLEHTIKNWTRIWACCLTLIQTNWVISETLRGRLLRIRNLKIIRKLLLLIMGFVREIVTKRRIFIWRNVFHLVCHHSSNNRSSFNKIRTCTEYKKKQQCKEFDSSKSKEHLTIQHPRKIIKTTWDCNCASFPRTRALPNFYLQKLKGSTNRKMRRMPLCRRRSPWFKLDRAIERQKKN